MLRRFKKNKQKTLALPATSWRGLQQLEPRLLLHADCAVPITENIRGTSVTFDECFDREFNHDGTDYQIHVYFTDSATGNGIHEIPELDADANGMNDHAEAMADEVETAYQFHLDRQIDFLPSGSTDEMNLFIAEDPRIGGIIGTTGINIDDDTIINDTLEMRSIAFHEIQHLVQTQYDSSPNWTQYGEGIARAIEDRVDSSYDAAGTERRFLGDVNRYLQNSGSVRDDNLFDISYDNVLWWTWLMDQDRQGSGVDPPVTNSNDLGWDALKDFYEELETQPSDPINAVGDFIADQGSTFRDDFIDFTLAAYAFEYNPSDPRLGFIDAEINGLNGLTNYNNIGTAFTTDTETIPTYSARYFELNPASSCDYTAFTFDGNGSDYGWSVLTVDGGNLEDHWTAYSDQWARTVRTADLDRIMGVVTAFDQGGTADIGHGCVVPNLSIKTPSSLGQAQVGAADNPRSFIARLAVTGSGGGAVAGLWASDFDVSISETGVALAPDIGATVINAAYVQDNYWLLIQAPGDGAGAVTGTEYDLTIDLGGISSDTKTAALKYVDEPQDVMIILDRSGSMGYGSGKIEAARNAAILLVDELSHSDQGGYVAFDTNATLRESLDQIGAGNQRVDLIVDIASETDLYSTSIGDGLRTALNDYNTNQDAAHACHFVLLSDGMENEPEYWADVKGDINSSGCAVHTIALGPETDEELMQEIADETGGSYDYATTTGNVPVNSTLTWESNVSRVYDNVSAKIAGRQRMTTQLPDSSVGGPTNGIIDFEDLALGTQYSPGNTFNSSGIDISVALNSNGPAVVQNQSVIGTGNEMNLNNSALEFNFTDTLTSLSFEFEETGGILQLIVNGQVENFQDFQDIHGHTIGGALVSVTRHQSHGNVALKGDVNSFSLFGQELVIDNVAFTGQEGNYHTFVVDDASEELMVSVAWRNSTGGSHETFLYDPAGNLLVGKRISSHGTNDVWQIFAPMPGTYKLEVKDLAQEYFVTASVVSQYQLHLFLGTPIEKRTQGVEIPIVASLIGPSSSVVVGAQVDAVVTGPDGNRQIMTLWDDGNHGDGAADDGIYGNQYTTTVKSDAHALNPQEGAGPAQSGSYIVNVTAVKDDLRREAMDSFAIANGGDQDDDQLPDQWEIKYGLNSKKHNDPHEDLDLDGLPNLCEFQLGTDPRNSDTDGGGESDGSEIILPTNGPCRSTGQDPLNPADDRLQGRLSIVLANPEAELINSVAVPYNKIIIGKKNITLASIDPNNSTADNEVKVTIFRQDYAEEGHVIQNWHVIANQISDIVYEDFNITPGASYKYNIRPELEIDHNFFYGQNLQSSQVTANADPYAPLGSILINHGDKTTSSQLVTLTIDAIDDLLDNHGEQVHTLPGTPPENLLMRVSNSSEFTGSSWGTIQTEMPQWNLEIDSGQAHVYVQFKDDHGNVSKVYQDMIDVASDTLVADAGPDLKVGAGSQVILDGSASHANNTQNLAYEWRQTSGGMVELNGANTVQASFTAPLVNATSEMEFLLHVSNGSNTAQDTVHITVGQPGDANFDGQVDISDLGILGANFNQIPSEWSQGNFNDDKSVDIADLGILGANWTTLDPSCSPEDLFCRTQKALESIRNFTIIDINPRPVLHGAQNGKVDVPYLASGSKEIEILSADLKPTLFENGKYTVIEKVERAQEVSTVERVIDQPLTFQGTVGNDPEKPDALVVLTGMVDLDSNDTGGVSAHIFRGGKELPSSTSPLAPLLRRNGAEGGKLADWVNENRPYAHIIYNVADVMEMEIHMDGDVERTGLDPEHNFSLLSELEAKTVLELLPVGDETFYATTTADGISWWQVQMDTVNLMNFAYQFMEPLFGGGRYAIELDIPYYMTWVSGGPSATNAGTLRDEFDARFATASFDHVLAFAGKNLDGSTIGIAECIPGLAGYACAAGPRTSVIQTISESTYDATDYHRWIIALHELGHTRGGIHGDSSYDTYSWWIFSTTGDTYMDAYFSGNELVLASDANATNIDDHL